MHFYSSNSFDIFSYKTLKYFNLKDNSLESKAGQAFSEAITINETITHLNLGRNPMKYKFIVEINKGIKANKYTQKKFREPNLVNKKQNLIDFIAIKESVLEEIQEAKMKKKIAQEEL